MLNQQVLNLEEALKTEKIEHQKLSSVLEQEKLKQISVCRNLKQVRRGNEKSLEYIAMT